MSRALYHLGSGLKAHFPTAQNHEVPSIYPHPAHLCGNIQKFNPIKTFPAQILSTRNELIHILVQFLSNGAHRDRRPLHRSWSRREGFEFQALDLKLLLSNPLPDMVSSLTKGAKPLVRRGQGKRASRVVLKWRVGLFPYYWGCYYICNYAFLFFSFM